MKDLGFTLNPKPAVGFGVGGLGLKSLGCATTTTTCWRIMGLGK